MSLALTSKQQEILEASLKVIERDGLKRFTMKNVAQEIGVTDAALYKHFVDKTEILASIATLFKESTLDILVSIHQNSQWNALRKLEAFVKGRAQQFQSNRALTVTLFSDELFRSDVNIASLNNDTMESHGKLLVQIVQDGQREGSIRSDLPAGHLVMMLTGPMRLMVQSWKSEPQGPALVDRLGAFWKTYERVVCVDPSHAASP